MLCIAAAYYYLNRADPDCGTTFTWVTQGDGPEDRLDGRLGDHRRRRAWSCPAWPSRRPVLLPALRLTSGRRQHVRRSLGRDRLDRRHDLDLLGRGSSSRRARSRSCCRRDLHARPVRGGRALTRSTPGAPPGSIDPEVSLVQPIRHLSISALTGGVLLGVFIYWGWDSGVAVNEESRGSGVGPGKSAIVSTLPRGDLPARDHRGDVDRGAEPHDGPADSDDVRLLKMNISTLVVRLSCRYSVLIAAVHIVGPAPR